MEVGPVGSHAVESVAFPSDFKVQHRRIGPAPYEITRTVNIKMRWRGRRLHEVMQEEFGYEEAYVVDATATEKLQLNDNRCEADVTLENGDVLKHCYIVQEPTVPTDPILLIAENEQVLVVQKPPGLPCHPQGKYQRLSLTEILRTSHLQDTSCYLHPVNRLDRQTSGLVILAKSRKAYMALTEEHSQPGISKVYVAKVKENLDMTAVRTRWSQWLEFKECHDGCQELICRLPLRVEKHKANQPLTVVVDVSEGKPSITRFLFSQSVVLCLLETGRTHQIRVHLAALGCPILGDSLYGDGCHTGEAEDMICLHAAAYSFTKVLREILPAPREAVSHIPGLAELLPRDATSYISRDPPWL